MLIVFSAGNKGDGGEFHNLNDYGTAKNVLTVGAATQPFDYETTSVLRVDTNLKRWNLMSILCSTFALTENNYRVLKAINETLLQNCNQFFRSTRAVVHGILL